MKACFACLILVVALFGCDLTTDAAASERLSDEGQNGHVQSNRRDLKRVKSGATPVPPPSPTPLPSVMKTPPPYGGLSSTPTQYPSKQPNQAPADLGCAKTGSCFFETNSPGFLKDICDDKPRVCPAKDCNVISGIYNATKYVVVDVNSFSYSGGPNKPPAVTVAAECCDACKKNKECNVWSYCDKDTCGQKGYCDVLYKDFPAGSGNDKKRGVFGSSCKDGYFQKGSCLLQRYSAADFKDAASKVVALDTIISGTVDRK